MELDVTIQLGGEDVPVGRLFTHARKGMESASFSYDADYIAREYAFPLAPDMPLMPGSIHTQGAALFRVFEDCTPDRWGRGLMVRSERALAREEGRTARSLLEGDLLVGVSDYARQGAIRLWSHGTALSQGSQGVPREVSIPALLAASDRAATDMDADIHDLVAAGSSLGGARPKASVIDEHGRLAIAKFPKAEESVLEDVAGWERTAAQLAERCDIRVPATRILRVANRSVLLTERFDRLDDRRIPYMSGLTAIQGTDGRSYSYLDLVDYLEQEGSHPEEDIQELWRRILLSCALGNTDDHMRNHGLLWDGVGWRLAPMFDVNPTMGDNPKLLSTAIDYEVRDADQRARWRHASTIVSRRRKPARRR